MDVMLFLIYQKSSVCFLPEGFAVVELPLITIKGIFPGTNPDAGQTADPDSYRDFCNTHFCYGLLRLFFIFISFYNQYQSIF
jgi:hypothetical protein